MKVRVKFKKRSKEKRDSEFSPLTEGKKKFFFNVSISISILPI